MPPTPPRALAHTRCRLSSVALVCERFRTLCLDPQLLRELDVDFKGAVPSLRQLRSLPTWLAANAHHATSLKLSVGNDAEAAAIKRCLATSCATAPLQQLTIRSPELPSFKWLLKVRSTLRTLEVDFYCSSSFFIDVPLQQLSKLQCLKLVMCPEVELELASGCSLPTSLTHISIWFLAMVAKALCPPRCDAAVHRGCRASPSLPTQLASLSYRWRRSLRCPSSRNWSWMPASARWRMICHCHQ